MPARLSWGAVAAYGRPWGTMRRGQGLVRGYRIPTYAYRRAPEQDGARHRHAVAVVGGGLVGLTLAVDLAQRGVPVVVLDDDDTVGVRGAASRGVCYARRSLEIFDRFGIYERIAAKGATWRVGRVMRDADCLYTFALPDGADRKHPPFVNLQQYYVEQFLAERLADFPRAEIRWKNEVVAASAGPDGVALAVNTPDGPYTVEADWAVACDGANSPMRRHLGVATESRATDDTWLIVDFWLGIDLPNERTVWIEAADNDGRAVWFGEIGLSGDVRPVSQAQARLKEAEKLGFERAFAPLEGGAAGGIRVETVKRLDEIVARLAPERPSRPKRQPDRHG